MAPSHLSRSSKPLSGRYLSFAKREEITILHSQKCGPLSLSLRPRGTIFEEFLLDDKRPHWKFDIQALSAQDL